MKAFSNIHHSNAGALYAIQELHLNGMPIELDPMFNRGTMYGGNRSIHLPKIKIDIEPQHEMVTQGNARYLPKHIDGIKSVILDPPWLISKTGTSHLCTRYGHFESKEKLILFIHQIIREAYRVLNQDGIMIFKCQDFNHDRRKFFMSLIVMNYSLQVGFNPLDELIIAPPSHRRSNTGDQVKKALHGFQIQ